MNKAIHFILTLCYYIQSAICPRRLSIHLSALKSKYNTVKARHTVGSLGKNSIIACGCHIEGGREKFIFIGDNTQIGSASIIECWGKWHSFSGIQEFDSVIKIGNNCSIGENNHITAIGGVTIGDGVLTGRHVLISDNNHGNFNPVEIELPPLTRPLSSKGKVTIGNNVWIGDKVCILGGVTIGDGCVIAANSVVTRDLPGNCITAGVPARVIKQI